MVRVRDVLRKVIFFYDKFLHYIFFVKLGYNENFNHVAMGLSQNGVGASNDFRFMSIGLSCVLAPDFV